MSAWRETTLGNVLTFQRGYDITRADQSDGPYAVISSSGPKSTHTEFMARGPGVIIGRKGTLGTVFYWENDYWPHDTTLWVKDFHGNHPRFVYYFLKAMHFERMDVGASNPTLNRNHIHLIKVRWPPLPIQRRIASILSAYDDLIENCERRIRVLDEMARALYREWFVLFRFPGHEKTPMVDSPMGRIPEGWEVRPLRDVCTRMESGGTPKRQRKDYWSDGRIDWFKTGELKDKHLFESEERITDLGLGESSAKLFPRGTILMAIYGATIGWLGILTCSATCNQAALGFIADDTLFGQRSLFLLLAELRPHFIGIAQGAAQQNISKDKVANTSVVVPPRRLSREFEEYVDPVFMHIEGLERKVRNLRKTRDLLLPRLLSGQLPVEGLE